VIVRAPLGSIVQTRAQDPPFRDGSACIFSREAPMGFSRLRFSEAARSIVIVVLLATLSPPVCAQGASEAISHDAGGAFSATVFGVSPQQLWTFARDLLTPALGFMFLFLYGLPLKEIPFIKDITDYKPSEKILPIFALVTLFTLSLVVGTAIFLEARTEEIDTGLFQNRFHVIRKLDLTDAAPTAIDLRLNQYDRYSNFRIFINGYRLFGSESNCALAYQCLDSSNPSRIAEKTSSIAELDSLASTELHDRRRLGFGSIHYVREQFPLPRTDRINHYLVQGTNFIDIHSENAGTGACLLDLSIELQGSSGADNTFTLRVDPNGGPQQDSDRPLAPHEVFYSGGTTSTPELPDIISPYETHRTFHLQRVCSRIRIAFTLSKSQADHLNADPYVSAPDDAFQRWAFMRVMGAQCALLFFGQFPYCQEVGKHFVNEVAK
jgi:hypothetical protein